MQWYYAVSGQQLGPVSSEEMQNQARLGNIQPDTLVWRSGLPNWTPASQAAELDLRFGVIIPRTLDSLVPKETVVVPYSGPLVSSTGPFVASILTTLFCCLPFGVTGIVYAALIGSKNARGDFKGAKEASKMAYLWSVIALGFGFVTLGLVASMSIPAFNAVREQSRQVALFNDARILGNAAQQYFLTTGKESVSFTYNPGTGMVSGDLSVWVNQIGKGYTVHDNTIEVGEQDAFSLSLPHAFGGEPIYFDSKGRSPLNPNAPSKRRR